MREFQYAWVNQRNRQIRITPHVERLYPGEILVVPTNEKGIHGAGLALQAKMNFGLKQGVGEGYSGQCYALPTKRRPHTYRSVTKIKGSVNQLIVQATNNLEITYLVPAIGTGLAKLPVPLMAEMCYPLSFLPNISLPIEFINHYVSNPELFPH